MAAPGCRFGPFVVDRVRYRVLRGDAVIELTPKPLDLLFHLIDHAGALVTKEQLLDALWPGANVTDNALAQAVSELRQALGDDASMPQFIKTVARRGYRFVAQVDAVDRPGSPTAPAATQPFTPPNAGEPLVAVMDFSNVTGDAESAWLAAGIAETVTGDLRATGRFRVVDRRRVIEAAARTNGLLQEVADCLGIARVVVGSYQRLGQRVRITGRIVNVATGEALADAKVDGSIADLFELQDRIVEQFAADLGAVATLKPRSRKETPILEAYRAYMEGSLQIETLDVGEIQKSIVNFERAIALDPAYAPAHTGLANARFALYETTRWDHTPSGHLLQQAVEHAQRAIAIDPTLAEAHATLAFILVSTWDTRRALEAARRAVALEPTNWRHFFRLGHAAWGEERLTAARNALALYPDFAFAHFQTAMVHVARGHLRDAETVLRQGAAVQDRQIARGERYPALGLHWLLALVRLAQDDVDEALRELDRERALAEPGRLYGREYEMSAVHSSGLCLLRMGRYHEAIQAFELARDIYPQYAQLQLGLALAYQALGAHDRSRQYFLDVQAIADGLVATSPVEAMIVRAQLLTANGHGAAACVMLRDGLQSAPPGFAGWRIPVEPLFHALAGTESFIPVLAELAARAR